MQLYTEFHKMYLIFNKPGNINPRLKQRNLGLISYVILLIKSKTNKYGGGNHMEEFSMLYLKHVSQRNTNTNKNT